MKHLLGIMFASVLLMSGCMTQKTDVIAKMLKAKGLTRETARFDAEMMDTLAASQALVQPHFVRYWKNPWELPRFAYSLTAGQMDACEKPEGLYEMFVISTVRTGHKVTGYLQFAPTFKPKTDKPLREALEGLCKRCGVAPAEEILKKAEEATGNVPAEVQMKIAELLFAAGEAKYYRDRALRNYPKERWQEAFDFAVQAFRSDQGESSTEFENGPAINWDLGRGLDFDDLYNGAVANIVAVMDLEKFLANPVVEEKPAEAQKPPEGQKPAEGQEPVEGQEPAKAPEPRKIDLSQVQFEFDTPLGKVAFNGKQEDNTYKAEEYLLIVDVAGNDTYEGPAAASWKIERPISTVVDWAGDDKYIADEKTPCAQGAGIFGYGFLMDNAGADTFRAFDNSQGASYFGVGILWARNGNDKFEARHASQGSASFGVANLVKKGGDDSYYCWSEGQGFGFVGGYGCLLDTGGNDRYVAEPYKLFRPGTGGHDNLRNYNFCQGAGWGQRGDISGGHSMAGGTGVLQDLGGDDWYECGVYGQATGYWYGTGILHDKAGNDHYEGSFFVQSGTAHMGLTVLLDEAGNDTYHVWHAISVGGAHDISVSWFIDTGGDDMISAWEWKDAENKQSIAPTGKKDSGGGVLVGSSVTNAIGVCVNIGGNDHYELYTESALGWGQHRMTPGSWRYELFNIGMFVDVGGEDTYDLHGDPPDWPKAKNNSRWVRNTPPGNPAKTFNMGIDTEKGIVPEAVR